MTYLIFTLKNSTAIYIKRFAVVMFALSFIACSKTAVTKTPVVLTPTAAFTVSTVHTLPAFLHESSGLCYTDGNLWTFGDSGNPNAIFKIDTASGAILQTVTVQNFANNDWEDIAADSLYIYVGDFGNNDGNRKDLKILRIKKSDLAGTSSQVSIDAEAINFSYKDQANFDANSNTNFDCEAIVAIDSNLYIFTKDGGDLQTRSYKIPKVPGTYALAVLDSFDTAGKVTSAAYNSSTKELALGGYLNNKIFPFIWFFKDYAANHFFSGAKVRQALNKNNTPWQTEGLDYVSADQMFLSCESTPAVPATLYHLKLQLVY